MAGRGLKNNTTNGKDDPIVSQAEAARQLCKSTSTIQRWCDDGLLLTVRMPSGLRGIRQSVINSFLGGTEIHTRVKAPVGSPTITLQEHQEREATNAKVVDASHIDLGD